jgi:hypothetical protein
MEIEDKISFGALRAAKTGMRSYLLLLLRRLLPLRELPPREPLPLLLRELPRRLCEPLFPLVPLRSLLLLI